MDLKTKDEIVIMKEGGALLSRTLAEVVSEARPGTLMRDLDELAESRLREGGGEPSFKGYRTKHSDSPFSSSLCISMNNEIVHGSGCRDITIDNGDIVGFDIGVRFKGLCTDMAVTAAIGRISPRAEKLIEVTRAALSAGLAVVRDGARVSDVGKAIEDYVKPHGFGIVRDLVGHGVGRNVHEDPHIPNYYDRRFDKIILKQGGTIAIEPMLTLGDWRAKMLGDGWTIVTADGSLAAHFEVTVAITESGYEILTPFI